MLLCVRYKLSMHNDHSLSQKRRRNDLGEINANFVQSCHLNCHQENDKKCSHAIQIMEKKISGWDDEVDKVTLHSSKCLFYVSVNNDFLQFSVYSILWIICTKLIRFVFFHMYVVWISLIIFSSNHTHLIISIVRHYIT